MKLKTSRTKSRVFYPGLYESVLTGNIILALEKRKGGVYFGIVLSLGDYNDDMEIGQFGEFNLTNFVPYNGQIILENVVEENGDVRLAE